MDKIKNLKEYINAKLSETLLKNKVYYLKFNDKDYRDENMILSNMSIKEDSNIFLIF